MRSWRVLATAWNDERAADPDRATLEQALASAGGTNLTMKRTEDGNGFDITFRLQAETADPYSAAEGTLATVFSAFTHGTVTTVELLAP